MKIRFEIKNTYEVDVDKDDYCDAIDYVSYNAYDIVESGEAKFVKANICSVTEAYEA